MAYSTRRDFLKTAAGVGLAAGLGGRAIADTAKRTATDWVTLGRSDVKVTRLAFGTGTYSGAAQRALGLTHAQLATLARNSIEAAFLDAVTKHRWIAAIDACEQDSARD